MALTKKCSKDKTVCKVTFKLEKDAVKGAKKVFLAGDFNHWTIGQTPLKKTKDGGFSVSLELETGKEYQFRYLIDGETWENDWQADRYEFSPFGNCENSVVVV